MSQLIVGAGQFVVTAAQGLAPQIVAGATNLAAGSIYNAAANALFGPVRRRTTGARRDEIRLLTAAEGVGIARVYGRARLAGEVIWATGFREETEGTTTSSGAKGVRRTVEQEHTTFRYSVSLAIGLCEGEISRIGRVWADGREISLQDLNYRLYTGSEDQLPDSLIEAEEGVGATPAFRGMAYIVFEDLPLGPFGNRIPQFNFEVERVLPLDDPGALEAATRAVTLIPASGEAVYHTQPVLTETGEGSTRPENVHTNTAETDFLSSIDHLEAVLPNAKSIELIVSWFGDDLRAGECVVAPRVEETEKTQRPEDWSVAGLSRGDATPVSRIDDRPAFGGTPSDEGVRQAITELTSRGLDVVFYPFLLMDIPSGNGLPDPLGAEEQPAYPWRGRLTCHPRASVDKTAAARGQVEAFFASYRTMILHYAELCAEVGGVSAFLIGSEMRELTNIRDEQNRFPAVELLQQLATDVRAILGPSVAISYAADWSEYANYRPDDGTGDVFFHLDPLWADPVIDFIGIDNYMPLTDWRAGRSHADAQAGVESIYDEEYLTGEIRGGEGFDWFYASDADRDAQIRTPIVDTAYGEDWVFRFKDLWSWWEQPHEDRPGGVKAGSTTGWVPQTKPFWFTELGCSATDKGSNQPNVFFDPKSSESFRPYFSTGERDDVIQRAFLEAHLSYWSDADHNPISPSYGGPMVNTDRIFLYTWDARPFPDFPVRQSIWSDAENWVFGYWLNGRAGRVPVGALIETLAADSGLEAVDASTCRALVTGYSVTGLRSARDVIEPLMDVYQLDSVEQAAILSFRPRAGVPQQMIEPGGLVDTGEALLTLTRGQESDLPAHLALAYADGLSSYETGVAEIRDPSATHTRKLSMDTGLVMEAGEAEGRAEALLAEARAMRTTARFSVPAQDLRLEPSDVVSLEDDAGLLTLRLLEITDGPYREVEAVLTDEGLYQPRYTGLSGAEAAMPMVPGPVIFAALDLPILPEGEDSAIIRTAAFSQPWPGQVTVYRGAGPTPVRIGTISSTSVMGRLTENLPAGPTSRWDRGTTASVRLFAGGFSSREEALVLEGGGRIAVEANNGQWEVLSYATATLQPDGTWHLTDLLRGCLRGTEEEVAMGAPVGALVVVLDEGQIVSPLSADRFGTTELWQAGPSTRAPGAFPFEERDVALTGTGARPFAPVFARAAVNGSTLDVSWIRRTRVGGDNWEAEEVPVGEANETYRVRSFDAGGGLLEEQTVSAPAATLGASGVARVTIAQLSDLFGAGREASLTL